MGGVVENLNLYIIAVWNFGHILIYFIFGGYQIIKKTDFTVLYIMEIPSFPIHPFLLQISGCNGDLIFRCAHRRLKSNQVRIIVKEKSFPSINIIVRREVVWLLGQAIFFTLFITFQFKALVVTYIRKTTSHKCTIVNYFPTVPIIHKSG